MTAGTLATSEKHAPLRRALVPVAVVAITVLVAASRMLVTPNFYFADDTQMGSIGLWYELGDRLLSGELPVLSPQAWQAGNYFAEGQWGLLNPISLLIGIGMRLAPDALIYASALKIALLGIMALGVYFLARSFGAGRSWAAIAGVLAPLAGFTAYMDAPSWVTGLFNTAVFPWVWWTLRRLLRGRSPLPFVFASYVLITFGYVFGVIVLVVLMVDGLVREIARRDAAGVRRMLLAAVWAGLWTIVVYLPGILTGPVTARSNLEVWNNGFLNADISDLGAMSTPTATASIGSWSGPVTSAPLVYIAWVLPLILLFAPSIRSAWKGLATPLTLAATMTILIIGPSDVGPLRWPIRFMPYLVLALVIVFAVIATRGYPAGVTRAAAVRSAIAVLVLNWLAWSATPQSLRGVAFSVATQLTIIAIITFLAGSRASWAGPLRARPAIATLLIAVSALYVLPQMRVFPATPLPTFAVPSEVEPMTDVLSEVKGDVMTVGDSLSEARDPASYSERLGSNLWYFSDASVSNLYTVLPFTAFSMDLCTDLKGRTCDTALDTLLSEDPTTGELVADLLSITHIMGYRETVAEAPTELPQGWRSSSEGDLTWMISREEVVAPAGGVTWAGAGTRVSTLAESETSVTVRIDEVGTDARVTFSRLPWPGYSVDGASITDPIRGYLLTIDLSGASVGDEVTITFRPPGYWIEVFAAVVAVLLIVAWIGLRVIWRRRGAGPERARETTS